MHTVIQNSCKNKDNHRVRRHLTSKQCSLQILLTEIHIMYLTVLIYITDYFMPPKLCTHFPLHCLNHFLHLLIFVFLAYFVCQVPCLSIQPTVCFFFQELSKPRTFLWPDYLFIKII